jgi:glutamate 5-kinase
MRSIVVKIGSSSITRSTGPDPVVLTSALDAALNAKSLDWNVVLVSSGAVSSGSAYLARTSDIHPSHRLAAAVGQPFLMNIYRSVSEVSGRHVCQLLISESDLRSPAAISSVCSVLNECADAGIVAIINGNDVIDKTGSDNDAIARAVAVASGADKLLILTDVSGVHDNFQDRSRHLPDLAAQDINTVRITRTGSGRGGMQSKLRAAELAAHNGIETHIASAGLPGVILACIKDEVVGTRIPPTREKFANEYRWISGAAISHGSIVINRPAEESIRIGASLFASGIKKVNGNFRGGDVIDVLTPSGYLIGRGISKISARLMTLIRSMKTDEIAVVLTEILHKFLEGNNVRPAQRQKERLPGRSPLARALGLVEEHRYELTRELALEIMNLFPSATAAAMFDIGGDKGMHRLHERYARLSSDLSLIDGRRLVVF